MYSVLSHLNPVMWRAFLIMDVKAPAFSFSKLKGMDAYLSSEMKSTVEAIGYDKKLHRAGYVSYVINTRAILLGRLARVEPVTPYK